MILLILEISHKHLDLTSFLSGIDSFTLEGSNDQMMWTNLASGNLVNPANYDDCDVPLEEFPTGTHSFQYIRLTAHTHFNSFGYGLMYMSVEA